MNLANSTHTACRQHVVDAIKTNILPKLPVRHEEHSGKLIATQLPPGVLIPDTNQLTWGFDQILPTNRNSSRQ